MCTIPSSCTRISYAQLSRFTVYKQCLWPDAQFFATRKQYLYESQRNVRRFDIRNSESSSNSFQSTNQPWHLKAAQSIVSMHYYCHKSPYLFDAGITAAVKS